MPSAEAQGSPGGTERRNPRTLDIDLMPVEDILVAINHEDRFVPGAVAEQLPRIAALVSAAEERYQAGGSIHYFGAGTSGRLAVLDAAELVPTFSVNPARFRAHHAGGPAALTEAMEDVEDDRTLGEVDAAHVTAADVAIGLTASGTTPYVLGALAQANSVGAYTALVTCNAEAHAPAEVDLLVAVDTGPEVIAGSTRLKAGTAQKLILNLFSTALMIRLGHTYSNLMVDVSPLNGKLRGRVGQILEEATGRPAADCREALEAADGNVKVAIVSLKAGVSSSEARGALDASNGRVRRALELAGYSDSGDRA